MKKLIPSLTGIPLTLILLVSCSKGIPRNFDYGTLENNTYTNTYFDFKMDVPEGWNIQTTDEMDELTKLGKDLVAGDNQTLKKQMEAADIRVANLLTSFQYEHGENPGYNPSFVINAENISNTPIKNGIDYLNAARKTLARSQMKITPTSSNERIELGGKEFGYFNADLNIQDITVFQRYYSYVLHNFSVNIIINYQTEAQKEILLNVLKTLKFN